jgi:cytosine/adenosine deaminase-related metal-dependent hydrolase
MDGGNIVSITGKVPAENEERKLVEFFAKRLREYVEAHDHLPEVLVWAMWGDDDSDGMDWATTYMSEPARSKVEAYATAAGLLLKSVS